MLKGLVADAFFGKVEEPGVLDVCFAFEDEGYHI